MNKEKDMLKRAWKRIEDPNNRCTHSYARDAEGNPVVVKSFRAVSFCSIGALESVSDNYHVCKKATLLLAKAAGELGFKNITYANDSDVVNNPPKLYARAIELASKEG